LSEDCSDALQRRNSWQLGDNKLYFVTAPASETFGGVIILMCGFEKIGIIFVKRFALPGTCHTLKILFD